MKRNLGFVCNCVLPSIFGKIRIDKFLFRIFLLIVSLTLLPEVVVVTALLQFVFIPAGMLLTGLKMPLKSLMFALHNGILIRP